ncbi:MAG: DUF72 domain-containing protein [Candidatus Korobacteraceae bacterium]
MTGKNRNADICIGTSGWQYKHWKGNFYPATLPVSRMLSVYCQHFNTVELNNSFYRLPSAEAFANWRAVTPRSFLFAVKASRFLTHMKKLKDPESSLQQILDNAEKLGEKLGPILFQLPPGWGADPQRLLELLKLLPRKHRFAFEFRDRSWHSKRILNLLRAHNAAFCIFELEGFRSALEITADFAYVRLHGPGGRYQGNYSSATLHMWARRIIGWSHNLRAVYVYFDNDQAGYAPANALKLRERVHSLGRRAA